jgi:nitrile hydratase subunit beta
VNGAHDMGGMHGFGPIVVEEDEPVYHAPWERTVAGTMYGLFATGRFAVDQLRRNIERQPPAAYLSQSYYERWLHALGRMVVEAGLVSEDELEAGVSDPSAGPLPEPTWTPTPAPPGEAPRFRPGDRVRARMRQPTAHTREPRYVRGRVGTVTHHYGGEPLPELAGEGIRREEHLYRVRFEATELWGPEAPGRDSLYIDLVESYLEPAP